jgi:hypothetical protein
MPEGLPLANMGEGFFGCAFASLKKRPNRAARVMRCGRQFYINLKFYVSIRTSLKISQ